MISHFRLTSWLAAPSCRAQGCVSSATVQVIDRSKKLTPEYCTYFCDIHKDTRPVDDSKKVMRQMSLT